MIRPATPAAIAAAAELIQQGELVAFPTETVYGLGADATNAVAVARIFAVKGRPTFDPLIVHVDAPAMLQRVVQHVPAAAMALIERYWPGPLTLVLPKQPHIPDIVTAGLDTVAVRLPDHPVAQALITAAARPIAAPSANPFGYVSPTTAAHVAAQLGEQIPLILDGGPCRVGVESTIVAFLDAQPSLLRPGGIALEDVEAVVGPVRIAGPRDPAQAPGGLPRHYAPRIPLEIVDSTAEVAPAARRSAGVLLPRPTDDVRGFAQVEVLSDDGDLATVAANLFAALRRLDASRCERLYAIAVAEAGLGRAIMDRLRRAAYRSDA